MFTLSYTLIILITCLMKIVSNELIIHPAQSTILRYQYTTFIAVCAGQKNTRVGTWQSPSQVVIAENSNTRITVERKHDRLRLRIRNLTQNDQGTWKCLGFDSDGNIISSTIQIFVKVPITFVSEPIQYAEIDSIVLIKCRVISNPVAEVSWYKGQDRIEISSSNYEQTNDGLKIYRVSAIDNDTFWCQADVIETGESKDYRIQVVLAQAITSTKLTCMSPCAVEKRTAILVCEAIGIPSPQYSWFYGKNDHAIVNGASKFIISGSRLLINYVDETDNGRYSCHAYNDFDKKGQRTEYILNMIIPPLLSSILPIEVTIDDNLPSKRVSFTCRLERGSIDRLSLQWFDATNRIVQTANGISIDDSQLMAQRSIELKFDPIRREHHGNYTCIAKNSADVASIVAGLIVNYKPVIIEPKMIEIYGVANHQLTIRCLIDSYPPPEIRWIKVIDKNSANPIVLGNNDPQVIDLFIKKLNSTFYETQLTYNPTEDDFGLIFECQVNNSRSTKHSIILKHAEPPRPVRISEVKSNSNSIELYIETSADVGVFPLFEYIVRYEQIDVPDSLKTIVFSVLSNQSEHIEIKSLQAATTYRIQIATRNYAGQSAFSTPIQVKTSAGDMAQFSLSNTSCTSYRSCKLQWFIQQDGGSMVLRAEISYAKIYDANKVGPWSKPINIQPTETQYELKELKPKTNYAIKVRLFNKAGYSERIIKLKPNTITAGRSKPSIWIIVGIITIIIIGTILAFILLILHRVSLKHRSQPNSESSPLRDRKPSDSTSNS